MELCYFDDVTVAFAGVKALSHLTLTIDSDQGITGIIGPNGAGKSTALNALTGSVRNQSGTARILGKQVDRRVTPVVVSRWGVGRTFQKPRPFAAMTVRENVLAGAEAHKPLFSPRHGASAEAVDDLLEQLKLAHAANALAGGLSLAERKRLELAKALATGPSLVLLDEMFEGLSETEIHIIVDALRSFNAQGIHFVFIEHVMRALRSLADHLVVLKKGELIAQGPLQEVLEDDAVRQAYLGFGKARL